MPIPFLNFQHLYYFWMVAREGGISHASEVLDLSPSTISAQVSQLEKSLQVKLFRRVGRNIRLTDVGQIAYRYADQIFGLGRELTHALTGWDTHGPLSLQVGIADAVPKLVATKLLQPAFAISPEMRLTCREGRPERIESATSCRSRRSDLSQPLPRSFLGPLREVGTQVELGSNTSRGTNRPFDHAVLIQINPAP